jgi:hypothetical protein
MHPIRAKGKIMLRSSILTSCIKREATSLVVAGWKAVHMYDGNTTSPELF